VITDFTANEGGCKGCLSLTPSYVAEAGQHTADVRAGKWNVLENLEQGILVVMTRMVRTQPVPMFFSFSRYSGVSGTWTAW